MILVQTRTIDVLKMCAKFERDLFSKFCKIVGNSYKNGVSKKTRLVFLTDYTRPRFYHRRNISFKLIRTRKNPYTVIRQG